MYEYHLLDSSSLSSFLWRIGVMPDGRIYLVSNAMPNIVRDPLYVSLSTDGWHFNETYVVASCELPQFAHPPQVK